MQLKLLGDRFESDRFTRHDTSVIATLPLAPDPEVLWERIGGPMRTKIRKAQKSGVKAHEGPGELDQLIHWEIIERACRQGLHTLDFGRSPIGASTLEFKQSFGAVLQPQPFFIQTRRGRPPVLDASSPGVQRGVRLLRRLPRGVVDALGPKLSSWIA